jgi:hypothetical protein
MRRHGRHARGSVTLRGPQVATVRQALADAAVYRRSRAAAWCPRCETAPDAACQEHVADLAAADAYDQLAREIGPE